MPQFAYRAINDAGRSVRGNLSATSETDLFRQLKEAGMHLVDSREVRQFRFLSFLAPKIQGRDLIQLCMHLEQLQAAGVPLLDGLEDVRDSTDQMRLKDLMTEVVRDVSEGNALSASFGRHPKVFDHIFVSLIAAGEESGNLTDSFRQLVKHLKWQEQLRAKIKKAMQYPTIVGVVLLGMFLVMMTFVVPQVTQFLQATGTELPILTTSLIATSNFVQGYWYVILLAPFGFMLFWRLARKSYAVRYHTDYWLIRLPIFGELSLKITLSRWSHFFATMFQSGSPILNGLETAQRVINNSVLDENMEQVRIDVQNGVALSMAMKHTGQFPNLVLRMVKIGEDSGNLADTLSNVTEFYDREVDETVDSLVTMIEPLLTFAAGLLMVWIIVAVLGPVYDTFQNI